MQPMSFDPVVADIGSQVADLGTRPAGRRHGGDLGDRPRSRRGVRGR